MTNTNDGVDNRIGQTPPPTQRQGNSLPSSLATTMDFPRPQNLTAKFVYNYYLADEAINDSGAVPREISDIPGEEIQDSVLNRFSTLIPRFMRIKFRPVSGGSIGNFDFQAFDITKNAQVLGKDLGSLKNGFVTLDVQDINVRDKLFVLTEKSFERRARKNNDIVEKRMEEAKKQLASVFAKTQTEKAKQLNQNSQADAKFLTDALNNLAKIGEDFIDEETNSIPAKGSFEAAERFSVRMQVNGKFVASLMESSINDPLSLYSEEFLMMREEAKNIQARQTSKAQSLQISDNEYEGATITPIDYFDIVPQNFTNNFKVIGYVIDKREVLDDGTYIQHDPIIIQNPRADSFIDFKIKYGTTYSYAIRSLVLLEMKAFSKDTREVLGVRAVLTSRPTSRDSIIAHEKVPPPPPTDLSVTYSYSKRSARLMWNIPVTSQRDIVKFQIFRRRSENEPFTLINVLDFDNSAVRFVGKEIVNPDIVSRYPLPKTIYFDREFPTDGSSYIYAVCSVDAHGQPSNYSNQISVSFDEEKNRINPRGISKSGAPRQYPNFYLKNTVFKETIKTSESKRIKIYFDPEYLDIERTFRNLSFYTSENVNLISKEQQGKYILQMMNTDLQQSRQVDIVVKDATRRNTDGT